MKKYNKAFADLDQAIRLNPQDDVAFYNRGNMYKNLEKYDQAIVDYDQAIRLNLQYSEAFYDRWNTYIALKKYDQAIRDYEAFIRLAGPELQQYVLYARQWIEKLRAKLVTRSGI